jgi:ribosomal protein L3 glutamine methyltransferase
VKLIACIDRQSARLTQAGVSFGHGTTNAFDEAVWLALWRLGLPLDDLDGVAERELSAREVASIEALVDERISTRKPAAYLTREAWLQGVPFYVDERAIVPRSLIAELITDGTLDAWLPRERRAAPSSLALPRGTEPAASGPWGLQVCTRHVLDLCTGNGSLAVLAALAWPEVQVDAADLSPDALAVARENVERHGLQERIALHQGDGLAAVAGRHYDLILCNPPYVNGDAMAALPPEYRTEPTLALAGGPDGMDFIRPLLAQARGALAEGGVLVLEIGHESPNFMAAFPTLEFAWLPTHGGDDQVVLITREQLT